MSAQQIVVVGGGLAGVRACEALRQHDYRGRIVLIGDEPGPPYDRPPLSKHLLAGDLDPGRFELRRPDEFAALDLDHRTETTVESLDLARRTIAILGGEQLSFDGLIIASGSVPRRLPNQPDVAGVMTLRTLRDSLALRDRLTAGHRLVVIGAGFIGLEVAATATKRGCAVTVLEGAPAPLIRGLGAEMGTAVAGVHHRNGVDLRCDARIEAIEHHRGAVRGVLADGELVAADTVLVGIGVRPATDWLEDSGLEVRDGVICDDRLEAAPGVFAAGDCARWVNRLFDEEMRIEHWTNAAEQGAAAAANLLAALGGLPGEPFAPVPFFWSDQFDSRIQFVGRAHGDDEVRVIAGDLDGKFAALYGSGGRLRGVLGVSMPKVVMPYRTLLAERATWDEALAHAGA